jgi:hypothetical protein
MYDVPRGASGRRHYSVSPPETRMKKAWDWFHQPAPVLALRTTLFVKTPLMEKGVRRPAPEARGLGVLHKGRWWAITSAQRDSPHVFQPHRPAIVGLNT